MSNVPSQTRLRPPNRRAPLRFAGEFGIYYWLTLAFWPKLSTVVAISSKQ